MIFTNNDLKKWSNEVLLSKNSLQLIAPGLVESLIFEKDKIISISSDGNNNELLCAKLATNLINRRNLVFFIDLAKDDDKSLFENSEIFNFIKNKNNAFFIINNFQELSGTKIWIKEFINFSKKYQITFYLFFDEIGLLYNSFFKRNKISHYYFGKLRFCEWIKSNQKISNIGPQTYKEFLESFLTIPKDKTFDIDIAKRLAYKIEKIIHHDVYDLYKKKFSIHSCLKILRYIAYARIPIFDLLSLSRSLGIDYFDLKEIIDILVNTKIIKSLKLISKDLKKSNLNYHYIVFCDPLNYYGFEGYNIEDNSLNNDLKIWTSILVNTYQQFSELQVVHDIYLPLSEQIGIYDPAKKAFLQMGRNHSSLGPLLVYLKNLNIKKTHYFGLQQLINFITNWQLKTLTSYKIN